MIKKAHIHFSQLLSMNAEKRDTYTVLLMRLTQCIAPIILLVEDHNFLLNRLRIFSTIP